MRLNNLPHFVNGCGDLVQAESYKILGSISDSIGFNADEIPATIGVRKRRNAFGDLSIIREAAFVLYPVPLTYTGSHQVRQVLFT